MAPRAEIVDTGSRWARAARIQVAVAKTLVRLKAYVEQAQRRSGGRREGESLMTVAVIFTSRRTLDHEEEYSVMAARMDELVREQPGFVSITSVRDPRTREGITVACFIDEDAVRAWRQQPEHAEAQRRGIADFYEEYHVTVANVAREYGSRS